MEISYIVDSFIKRQKAQAEERITVAYIQSMWTIQWLGKKKPKPLKNILEQIGQEKKPMTAEGMLAKVKQLNAMFGGEIINGQ